MRCASLSTSTACVGVRLAGLIWQYAPYFVRWQQGPAQLKKDEGDLAKGDVIFHVEGDGPKGNGEQKAWFQVRRRVLWQR